MLILIVFLQSATIVGCCFIFVSRRNKINILQNSLQQIETQIDRLTDHRHDKPATTKFKNSINGIMENHKKGSSNSSSAVTVVGSSCYSETLHTSLSTPNLSSISSSSLSQEDSRDNNDQVSQKKMVIVFLDEHSLISLAKVIGNLK